MKNSKEIDSDILKPVFLDKLTMFLDKIEIKDDNRHLHLTIHDYDCHCLKDGVSFFNFYRWIENSVGVILDWNQKMYFGSDIASDEYSFEILLSNDCSLNDFQFSDYKIQ